MIIVLRVGEVMRLVKARMNGRSEVVGALPKRRRGPTRRRRRLAQTLAHQIVDQTVHIDSRGSRRARELVGNIVLKSHGRFHGGTIGDSLQACNGLSKYYSNLRRTTSLSRMLNFVDDSQDLDEVVRAGSA